MARKSSRTSPLVLGLLILMAGLLCAASVYLPYRARVIFGPPAVTVGPVGLVKTSAKLLLYKGMLIEPLDPNGTQQTFVVAAGESVVSVAERLEQAGLVRSADGFITFMVYSGLDTSVQAGEFTLSPAMSSIMIAFELQDASSGDVSFVILPGWRMEEIAASLPTSGLSFSQDEFLAAARSRPVELQDWPGVSSAEGFLFPGAYLLPRTITVHELISQLVRTFNFNLTAEMRQGFSNQGLNVYQAVILASIIQREAVEAEEQPWIASVFLNRMRAGMRLGTDPTVQYALGYNANQSTWWTNPLSLQDLEFESPYNTYLYAGLPPGPISNPGLSALQAVAFPEETTYYYFRARCDGTGLHAFAETFEQHIQNACR